MDSSAAIDLPLGEPLAPQRDRSFFGHPSGLGFIAFTEAWERFSYYGMRGLLIFYLTEHFLFSDTVASGGYGAYTTLVYMVPLVGGYLADRYIGAYERLTGNPFVPGELPAAERIERNLQQYFSSVKSW